MFYSGEATADLVRSSWLRYLRIFSNNAIGRSLTFVSVVSKLDYRLGLVEVGLRGREREKERVFLAQLSVIFVCNLQLTKTCKKCLLNIALPVGSQADLVQWLLFEVNAV